MEEYLGSYPLDDSHCEGEEVSDKHLEEGEELLMES